ncbi:MAG TPA: SusE domain-containing protein [Balneolaceae bacterium]|nr:SusE domain-containing protein [Balneolaceae bacterium]
MKKLTLLLIALLGTFVLFSCKVRDTTPVLATNPGSPSITAPKSGQSYTLMKSNASDTVLSMQWTKPNYGVSTAINYSVQMDTSSAFSNPIELGSSHKTTFSMTEGELNSKLLSAGMAGGVKTSIQVRVLASVSDSIQQQVSDPVSISVTPYSVCKYCPDIYVPGSYQSASGYGSDWTPGDAPALATTTGLDQYEGYIYFKNPNSQFKITADQSWSTNWGAGSKNNTLDPSGGNLTMANAGYYKVNVDLNALTYSVTKTTWSVIGDAVKGWNTDVEMTFNPSKKTWTVTTDLTQGGLKFRANDSWDINYGDNGGDGTLESGGSNINISQAGNYTITLNLSTHPYTYSLTKN